MLPTLLPLPLLADFALRLAGGMAALLLVTSWRAVPVAFFRTHCQIILGLLVLAALVLAQGPSATGGVVIGLLAAVAFAGSVAWGLGLPRIGRPLIAVLTGSVAAVLMLGPGGPLAAAGRLASAALLGATLTAMLLGHYYLTAPAMSIEPLKRFVRAMALALGARAGLAAVALGLWAGGRLPTSQAAAVAPLFLAARWGLGLLAPALATGLAWKTVQIRSTQSATGILYVAMTFVLFGELTAMTLTRAVGVAF